ncbi:ATP-dependent DNA helicase RecQ [Pseudochelatococcus lubricantis]|uniref:DNA helicase RecQ n=1 Tax=Pseudochelatococcus lubricantis TaxID=1538102 RepID=A0ABX0UW01_9HYPH|nr:DNA helicase RecQ [Pseudochelatococcus lubricantis]NIJ56578.1 ATP-dependent DNA helicase RecQ [Pseudochelatococcus lubricantis]
MTQAGAAQVQPVSPALAQRARAVLKSVFGYDDFRPGQDEVIAAVLNGENVFAVMPTGSGKSMCYQLPAMTDDGGMTLVVSPLVALMRDQVGQLTALGVPAATINSANTDDGNREAWRMMRRGELKLLFVSPEKLAGDNMLSALRDIGIRRLAIDEAHCVSQWGHDFRPDYRNLRQVREQLGSPQTIALTATADRTTRADIVQQLFPEEPRVVVHSFDRPNLDLRFAAKERPASQLAEFVLSHKGASGIIYTSARKRTEEIAESLSQKGVRALAYHAGLDQALRGERQDRFLQENDIVMVATVAFGMGINKPDVRFVAHADMPGSIEGYYQEIGRAGRDGLPAWTLTLYGASDMALRRRQIDEKDIDDERRRIEHRRLNAMIELCETATCRRQALLAYFGEASEPCGGCDLCRGGVSLYDATIDAQKVLSAIARTGQRFGAAHIADILTGTENEAVSRLGHDKLKTFGVGADKGKRTWLTIIRQLFATGAVGETGEAYSGYRLTQKGEDILFGREKLTLRAVAEEPRRRRDSPRTGEAASLLTEAENALFQHLRSLRLELAKAENAAAYMVFPDRTLVDMARLKPTDLYAMRMVQGVGEHKLERYGQTFADAIAAFLRENR